MTVSLHIFILAALITTAIAAGGAPENFPESVNTLQDQTEAISEVNTQEKRMAILEAAIGETVARLLEKINQLQRTVDDHKATIDKLTDSNTALSSSNDQLKANLTNRMGILERSMAESTICSGVRECLYVEAKEREALSKDLFDAGFQGNAEEVRRLASMGAHLEYSDDIFNETALLVAAGHGRVEAVRALIELGAHLEARRINALTPLHAALDNKREKCVELLLSAGASVQVRDINGQTPLHYAARCGPPYVVQMLIDAGADWGAKDNNGNTPKNLAKDTDIISLLNSY